MANVAVMGDFNEFQFFPALQILKGNVSGQTPVLTNLITTLPVGEQYTYYFDGNAQALDHLLVSNSCYAQAISFSTVSSLKGCISICRMLLLSCSHCIAIGFQIGFHNGPTITHPAGT